MKITKKLYRDMDWWKKAVKCYFESHLKEKCLIIGYWHLITILLNTITHLAVIFVLTNGYECDVSKESLIAVQWDWLEPTLLVMNFGVHGFYPFPLIFNYHHAQGVKYIQYLPLPDKDVPCSSGWLHVDWVDYMYFVFNVMWLNLVWSFIVAVHRKDPAGMITFFLMTILKLALQIKSFAEMSSYNNPFFDIAYKLVDVCLIIVFMMLIMKYVAEIRNSGNRKYPPGFFETIYDKMGKLAEEEKKKTDETLDEKMMKEKCVI